LAKKAVRAPSLTPGPLSRARERGSSCVVKSGDGKGEFFVDPRILFCLEARFKGGFGLG
jgi:hypothetical protein